MEDLEKKVNREMDGLEALENIKISYENYGKVCERARVPKIERIQINAMKEAFVLYPKKELDIIEKDLRALSILKKHIYKSDCSLSIILDDLRDYDDFQILERWLNEEAK